LNELHTPRRRPEASTSALSAQAGTSSEETDSESVDRSKGFLMVNKKYFISCVNIVIIVFVVTGPIHKGHGCRFRSNETQNRRLRTSVAFYGIFDELLLLSQVDEVGGGRDIESPRLSQQLLLDSLWNTLSECLQVTSISVLER
jgi:hypothetical protein